VQALQQELDDRGLDLGTVGQLEAAHGVLQSRLARQLRMKRTPQLTFEYDPSVERGVRMSQLIDELAPEDDANVD